MSWIEINGRKIGTSYPPYIIAEMSANHNGSLDRAKDIITAAKSAGADAVKLQTYRPDTITLKSDAPEFRITEGLWKGQTLYDLYESAYMPWEWHAPLFEFAKQIGITLFSSPFDHSAVDLLSELDAPAYKIASFEVVDIPLIRHVARQGKPMIISTGMADLDEISTAVTTARDAGCDQLALLLCVSGYPAPAADYNLRTILDMAERFDMPIGLSDHTLDNTTAIASVALGASLIEKHFTLDRSAGGADDSFSLEPSEFSALCQHSATAWEALGAIDYGQKSSELGNVKFRRSLYFVKSLPAGAVISPDSVRSVRPGYGLAPKHYDDIIGQTLLIPAECNHPVTWDHVKPASS